MSISPHIDLSAWYLDEEAEMGEGRVQTAIIELLKRCLLQLAADRGWTDYVIDSDQYIAWMPSDPNVRVAPDIYLLWNPPEQPWVDSWQTWRPDHPVPVFALEVVSYDWHKDYVHAPEKYDDLGVDELIVFDPSPDIRPRGGGVALQHWVREPSGLFRRRPVEGTAVWSEVFGVFFVQLETRDGVRLRLADTAAPLRLIPSPEERAELLQLRADQAQAGAERARAAADAARAATRRALASAHRERSDKEQAQAEKEQAQAEKEQAQAEKERARADSEQQRAQKERYLALLRQHGIDPD